MSPKKLPTAAETIRLSIKDMIPELSGKTTENSAKVIQLPISNLENCGWRLVYCRGQQTMKVRNGAFFIPLSENALCEKAPNELQEGYYDEIKSDTLVMNPKSAAIFIVPKRFG
ncbi:hypothetical protein VTN31DRAFT_4915 [Thermomyces dupontii]|uniref:uncharacterized protein n=1 Tax=Talaromyces thermophilus TaxID=28565 RepID=UPI0037440E98